MMTILNSAIIILMLCLIAGLGQVLRRRERLASLLSLQLLGTLTVAIMILLSLYKQHQAYLDVALLIALLALISVTTFIARGLQRNKRP